MRAPLLALGLVVAAPAAADEVGSATYATLATSLADRVAIPAYAAYADAAGALPRALAPVCAGERDEVEAARAAFREMVVAWQHAEPIALGPATAGFGRARIHWWPDERGTGERQLRRVLFEADEAALDPAAIAEASVAVKGLSALARLLHAQDLAETDYACRYTLAVARHQADLAGEIHEGWTGETGFRAEIAAATDGESAVFYTAQDAAQAWLQSLAETLDLVVVDKLEAPLGPRLAEARSRRAELAGTQLALPSIAANLETVRAMLAVDGGFADALAAADAAALGAGLVEAADTAIARAEAITLPLAQAVADADARGEVEALLAEVKRLRLLAGGAMANELGLVRGFNAADGD
jgi:predicted lipoprotein